MAVTREVVVEAFVTDRGVDEMWWAIASDVVWWPCREAARISWELLRPEAQIGLGIAGLSSFFHDSVHHEIRLMR